MGDRETSRGAPIPVSLIDENQRAALTQVLGQLMGGGGALDTGGLFQTTDIENLSLAGLENLAAGGAQTGTPATRQATGSLQSILGAETGQAAFEDFFQTNIQQPALRDFQRDVLPAISRGTAATGFFGDARERADARAQEELLNALTKARSAGALQTRDADRAAQIAAASGIGNLNQVDLQTALSVLGAGGLERDIGVQELGMLLQRLGLAGGLASGSTFGIGTNQRQKGRALGSDILQQTSADFTGPLFENLFSASGIFAGLQGG